MTVDTQPSPAHELHLDRAGLRGRTFILGNKRALSLALPAASGPSPTLLHSHKWFGAYLYAHKFLEGQVVRVASSVETPAERTRSPCDPRVGRHRHTHLSSRTQTGFTMGPTFARREHLVNGVPVAEEFFLPDGLSGFACTVSGDLDFEIEPELDLRFSRALTEFFGGYDLEAIENGVVVWSDLPTGTYDDATETFVPDPSACVTPVRLYAAVQIAGEAVRSSPVPSERRVRRIVFRKDQQRYRFLSHSSHEDVADHAPLWQHSSSHVYVPVLLQGSGQATVVYGFGRTRDEALAALAEIRDTLPELRQQKRAAAESILGAAAFDTGEPRVDSAYAQVLTRFADALVARDASPVDTALAGTTTMILAGNGYFHDCWKRDENIALGSLLTLGFYDLARAVIDDTWQLQDPVTGRLPLRIRPGEKPAYHSSDGTLWALYRLHQYWRCTGDDALLRAKLPLVRAFFQRSLERVVDGMLPSGRTQAADYLWETWMDTPHTPRHGFPVEIQMLWLACLRAFQPVIAPEDAALATRLAGVEAAAFRSLERFNVRGMPADSLDEDGIPRDLITPNPYFCFGLGLDLGPKIEGVMRQMGRRELVGRQGIATLARQDWPRVFSQEFLDDRRNVRGRRMRSAGKFNYHRGVEWNWLAQLFVHGELKYGQADAALRVYLQRQIDAVLDEAGIGGISELFDLSGARGPDFQTWSMSGFLEALHAFAGVRIDVPGRRIVVEPQIPRAWPHLRLRKWYGSHSFDLHYDGRGERQNLRIDFVDGDVPDAEIEIAFHLPAHQTPRFVEAVVDGVPHQLSWRRERVAGSRRSRVRVVIPAARSITLTMEPMPISGDAELTRVG